MLFLTEGEGPCNVFNFMILENLLEISRRSNLSKNVKMLAVRRYLDANSKTKVDGAKSNAQIHLVSYTTFFSDKYEKTSESFGSVYGDANILLFNLIKTHMLYSEFSPQDLPTVL